MEKNKVCCFTVNYAHSCIIVNNFIKKENLSHRVVYISEKDERKKIKNIISKFYSDLLNKVSFEKDVLDYENVIYVVSGKVKFVNEINKTLENKKFNGYIINCFEIYDIKNIEEIIANHDYYINTEGLGKKEFIKVS